MVERQDIDALLISALYGELTPSEETRLAAHLDSHPADRTALADLTHARGLIRESRLLQVQLEPPQSVSTLLMNEAKRCAPKPPQEGWFARFVRSFAAHPAMAAAAMLVVVLGVATLAVKKKADFADSTAPAAGPTLQEETVSASDSPAAPGMIATPAGAAAGSGSAMAVALEDAEGDQYRVALDEGIGQGQQAMEKEKRADETKSKDSLAFGALTKEQATKKAAKPTPNQGIELRAPAQPAPKDFDDDTTRRKGGKNFESAADNNDKLSGDTDGRIATESTPRGGVSTGAASGGAGRSMDPSTSSTTTADSARPATPRATTPSPPPPAPPKADPRPAPAKTVARDAPARAAGPADEKPADPQLAWARDQHAALIAQVRAGDCKKAAAIATNISNRAPAYYQQNVETDRAVKACVVYINNERERDAEQRNERARANQKRSVNEPAKAAPPSKPAADTTK